MRPHTLTKILVDLLLTAAVVWAFTTLIVPEIQGLLAEMTASLEAGFR